MLWSEVRELFPETFVLVEDIKSHEEGNKIVVEEVAVIKRIDDPAQAWNELFAAKGGRFVYHTSNDRVEIKVGPHPLIRRQVAK